MQFSVIYSVDTPSDIDVLDYAPPQVEELWDETENDDQFEYGYLEGRWEGGHHRKWYALLTRDQFDLFVSRCGLVAEDVHTLGSIGAPGCGYGCAPAISFNGGDEDAIQNAYVTPIPEVRREVLDERDWDRVRRAILAVYS